MDRIAAKCFSVIQLTLLALALLFGPAANVASAAGFNPSQSISLAWNPSTNTDIVNYNVYYGVASGLYTNVIAVGNSTMATMTGLIPGMMYFFTVTAEDTNGMESAYSNETNCMAPISTTLPVITVQPASQAVLIGGSVTFRVTVAGASPFTYQWSFDGTSITGATNASLTLLSVLPGETGNYAVLVGNSYGSALSSDAVLTLATPPAIAVQPASQSVETNCSATFNVMASGTAPLSYQWYNNGVALASQTNANLTMTDVQISQFGNYTVAVNNAFGAVTSTVAVLALASPPMAGTLFVQRFPQGGVRFNVSALLSNATVARYDSLTVAAVSSNSTFGGTVTMDGPWIYYTPPAGTTNTDYFTYTLSDGHCGMAVGMVVVEPSESSPQPLQFSIGNVGDGSLQLSFQGMPNTTYQLQYSADLSSQNWQVLATQSTDEFGFFQFIDWPVANVQSRLYRVVWMPSFQSSPAGPGQ